MSRSAKTMVAVLLIMAVAVIAAGVQKAMEKGSARESAHSVSAYGANNVLARSPADEMAAVVKAYQSARDTITYRFFQNDVIAVSGTTPHGMVFYQREVVYPAVIYTLRWSYPAAGQTRYDALVTQTVDSFGPGPAHSG